MRLHRWKTNESLGPREDATFPATAPESVCMSAAVDAMEHRNVATADMPGMFLQTPTEPGTLFIMLRGEMLRQCLSVAPEAEPCIKCEKGKPVLCCECAKALCGSLKSGRISHLKLTEHLLDRGF